MQSNIYYNVHDFNIKPLYEYININIEFEEKSYYKVKRIALSVPEDNKEIKRIIWDQYIATLIIEKLFEFKINVISKKDYTNSVSMLNKKKFENYRDTFIKYKGEKPDMNTILFYALMNQEKIAVNFLIDKIEDIELQKTINTCLKSSGIVMSIYTTHDSLVTYETNLNDELIENNPKKNLKR